MADVSIIYKGSTIAELSDACVKTLKTEGCYCEGDIDVEYTPQQLRSKVWLVSVPTAVARKYTTLLSGDLDVAAHYADDTAVAVVLKLTNTTENGLYTVLTKNAPDGAPTGATTSVVGRDANNKVYVDAINSLDLNSEQSSGDNSNYHILATPSGDIKVMAGATKTNFGGADYLVVFAW